MPTQTSIINFSEIRDAFKEHCEEEDKKFTETEFSKFLECCERDFYQWINDNLKFFISSYN